MRTIVTVPVLTDAFAKLGVPLTLVNTAGPTVYVSGLPPYDPETGELVRGGHRHTDRRVHARADSLPRHA